MDGQAINLVDSSQFVHYLLDVLLCLVLSRDLRLSLEQCILEVLCELGNLGTGLGVPFGLVGDGVLWTSLHLDNLLDESVAWYRPSDFYVWAVIDDFI